MTPPPTRTAARAAQVEEARDRRARAGRITASLRRAVIERDGEGCCLCWDTQGVQMDHIKPVRFGGKTVLENLRLLCSRCNESLGDGTRGEARTCGGCLRQFRRGRPKPDPDLDKLCDDCIKDAAKQVRRELEASARKRVSEWKRVRNLRLRRSIWAGRAGISVRTD